MKRNRRSWTPPSVVSGGPDTGAWVVVATLSLRRRDHQHVVPVLGDKGLLGMRRYQTQEEAIAGGGHHPAVRVGGGWALNVETGETVRIHAFGPCGG
jgi:hypothetical protein